MVTRRSVLGLDLGPPAAFTALAVVERTDDRDPDADPAYAVRHLRRFPPGTAYAAVAGAVADLLATEPLHGAGLAADVTAVGAGVLDLFRALDPRPPLTAVVLTAGHHAECGPHDVWQVPKKDLVTGLQLLLQGRRLAIPSALPEAALLARELGAFRAKAGPAADPAAADWRDGRDDDLVLAVALGCWQAGRLPAPLRGTGLAATAGRGPAYPARFFPDVGRKPWGW